MRIFSKFKQALGVLSPSCREAVRLQSKRMDGPLTLGQRIGLRIHLILCKWCRRYGEQIGFLQSTSRRSGDAAVSSPPAALSSAARERIRKKLEEARK